MNLKLIAVALVFGFTLFSTESIAQQPGWTGRVLKVGIDRQVTDSVDIVNRPYRPFHFYGNTVRRQHYRGFPLPLPRDVVMSAYAIVNNRQLWFDPNSPPTAAK